RCGRCHHWGHLDSQCNSKGNICARCDGPHKTVHHRILAACCKPHPKANPPQEGTPAGEDCPHPARCCNCGGTHPSDSPTCRFWTNRFDRDWITRRYARLEADRAVKPDGPKDVLSSKSAGKRKA